MEILSLLFLVAMLIVACFLAIHTPIQAACLIFLILMYIKIRHEELRQHLDAKAERKFLLKSSLIAFLEAMPFVVMFMIVTHGATNTPLNDDIVVMYVTFMLGGAMCQVDLFETFIQRRLKKG